MNTASLPEHSVKFTWPKVFLTWGVVIPLLAIAAELLFKPCASVFFDPIPTVGHLLLLLSIPTWNLAVYRHLRGLSSPGRQWLWFGAGLAIVTSTFYLLATWLIGLYSFVLVIFVLPIPLCLLGSAPVLAWLSWFSAFAKLRREKVTCSNLWMWLGVGVAFLGIVISEVSTLVTVFYVKPAAAGDVQALQKLRRFGSSGVLADLCYREQGVLARRSPGTWIAGTRFGSDMAGRFLRSMSIKAEDARELYFRVTGDSFDTVKPSKRRAFGPSFFSDDFAEWTWDQERGGEAVGVRLAGLYLTESSIDWKIESDAALAYGEWTLVFENHGARDQEARCQILLPPGGVVSRLTLWVNDKPEEAAFAAKEVVTAAYRQVVKVERRDPVLVNHVGPDRVMMQCFPVTAKTGRMKVRIGMTVPVHSEIRVPILLERNFSLASNFFYHLKAVSDQDFEGAQRDGGQWIFDKKLNPEQWRTTRLIMSPRASEVVWTSDPFAPKESSFLIRRTEMIESEIPSDLVVIVDTSKQVGDSREQILQAIKQLPSGVPVTFYLASDDGWIRADRANVQRVLNEIGFIGGRDSVPALIQALHDHDKATHLWIHGPQPNKSKLLSTTTIPLFTGRLYAIEVVPGPNRLLEWFPDNDRIQAVSCHQTDGSFTKVIKEIVEPSRRGVWRYERSSTMPTSGKKVSDQLARYWASQEVHKTRDASLAARYQIVTPVSGAVVLETKTQYEKAGLKQADSAMVPGVSNVPEPSPALLVALALLWLVSRRRR